MKTFEIKAFGQTYNVTVHLARYNNDSLAIVVNDNTDPDEPEPFGVLTVNLCNDMMQTECTAFVKDWSENEQWAESLAKAIGGTPTGIYQSSGHVTAQLWNFTNLIKNQSNA